MPKTIPETVLLAVTSRSRVLSAAARIRPSPKAGASWTLAAASSGVWAIPVPGVPLSGNSRAAATLEEGVGGSLDGVGLWVENRIKPIKSTKTDEQLEEEIKTVLKETGVEILVSYLPVGSDKVTEFWANICLDTNTAFVNCIPSFIASDEKWAKKFEEKNIPVIGDDIKGQVGATIVHRTLAKLCSDRGTKIETTYQINVGGNTDFLNMKEQDRLASKRISKTESVQSQLATRLDDDQIYVGP